MKLIHTSMFASRNGSAAGGGHVMSQQALNLMVIPDAKIALRGNYKVCVLGFKLFQLQSEINVRDGDLGVAIQSKVGFTSHGNLFVWVPGCREHHCDPDWPTRVL